jgi:hypothetical protein
VNRLFDAQRLRFLPLAIILDLESIEDVSIGTAAPPCIVQQAAEMAEVLIESRPATSRLALGFDPTQVVQEFQLPERAVWD